MINWYLPTLDEISSGKKDASSEEGTVGTANFYKVSYNITWGDDFESDINSIAFKFEL